jgi:ribose-phosphate pyrophosphokinase
MKTLNLLESNAQVELRKFAGGECHVKLHESYIEGDSVRIVTRLNSSDDLMYLCLVADALRNSGVKTIQAFIPYMPYARQDRVMVPGEPLSVKVVAGIINSLDFDKVEIFDAHSDVVVALLNNCKNISNHEMVRHFLSRLSLKEFVLVSPDLGAFKKVDKLAQEIKFTGELVTGIKVRDLSTGEIIKSDVLTDDLKGKACVIVDDICDGGRTFIELASALKEKNAGELYFIASHGIFSHNAMGRLRDVGFRTVCSSNSISDLPENDFYKKFDLFKDLE